MKNPGSRTWLSELRARLVAFVWIGAGEDGGAYGRWADDQAESIRRAIAEEKALILAR